MAYQFNFQYLADTAPVVALHASASSGRQWAALSESLCDRHHVITPDLPGYGSDVQTGMTAVANEVIRATATLGEPVHMIGHSFGGGVALKIALMNPGLVKSLTLFEPTTFHLLHQTNTADDASLNELKHINMELQSEKACGHLQTGMKRFVDFWSGNDTFENLSASRRKSLAAMTHSVIADLNNCLDEKWTAEQLVQLEMPVQVLMGLESPSIAQRASTLVFDAIPEAELVMLPGLGHMAPIDAPNWVNPRIQQHIARVERSAGHIGWPHRQAA